MARRNCSKEFNFSRKTSAECQKALRERKKQAGLCVGCGKEQSFPRCEECRQKINDATNDRREKRRQSEKCIECGGQRDIKGTRCVECKAINAATQNEIRKKKIADGVCVTCRGSVIDGELYCGDCRIKSAEYGRIRKSTWAADGKCNMCGGPSELSEQSMRRGEPRKNYCKLCWLKTAANRALGSTKHWQILANKLDECEWRCPYTGEELILGENVSFDHIDPVCRFPEKQYDPNNIEPVSWQVNMMKNDLTKEEFLAMVEKIYLHNRRGTN